MLDYQNLIFLHLSKSNLNYDLLRVKNFDLITGETFLSNSYFCYTIVFNASYLLICLYKL